MSERVLLVDYENVGKVDLGAVPVGVRVPFFFGASQKSVPTQFLKAALKLGDRFVPINMEGQGKNALDFHIAFYLGEYLARTPAAQCIVLSKDKGFDPLIRHLSGRGFTVRRAATLGEAFPMADPARAPAPARAAAAGVDRAPLPGATSKPTHEAQALLERALAWLEGMQKNRRPRKRKGLVAHLHSRFSKKISEEEIGGLIDRLVAERRLTESAGTISYHF